MDRILTSQLKLKHMNVNELMNMNDMYYVGNLVDVDGNGWVSKAEAQQILNELGMGDDNNNSDNGYGDESPAECLHWPGLRSVPLPFGSGRLLVAGRPRSQLHQLLPAIWEQLPDRVRV